MDQHAFVKKLTSMYRKFLPSHMDAMKDSECCTKTMPNVSFLGHNAPLALLAAFRKDDKQLVDLFMPLGLRISVNDAQRMTNVVSTIGVFMLIATYAKQPTDEDKVRLFAKLTSTNVPCILFVEPVNMAILSMAIHDSACLPPPCKGFFDKHCLNMVDRAKEWQTCLQATTAFFGKPVIDFMVECVRPDLCDVTRHVLNAWFTSTSTLQHIAAMEVFRFTNTVLGPVRRVFGNVKRINVIRFIFQFAVGGWNKQGTWIPFKKLTILPFSAPWKRSKQASRPAKQAQAKIVLEHVEVSKKPKLMKLTSC